MSNIAEITKEVTVFHLKNGQISLGRIISETDTEFTVSDLMLVIPTKNQGETSIVPAGITFGSLYNLMKDGVLYYYKGDKRINEAFEDTLIKLNAAKLGIEISEPAQLKKIETNNIK